MRILIMLGLLALVCFTGCNAELGQDLRFAGRIILPNSSRPVNLGELRGMSLCYKVRYADAEGQTAYPNGPGYSTDLTYSSCTLFEVREGSQTDQAVTLTIDDLASGKFTATVAAGQPYDPRPYGKDATAADYRPVSIEVKTMILLRKELYPATFNWDHITRTLGLKCPAPFWHPATNARNARLVDGAPGMLTLSTDLKFEIDPFLPESMYVDSGIRGNCPSTPENI